MSEKPAVFEPVTVTLGKSHRVTVTNRKQFNLLPVKRRMVELYEEHQNCNVVADIMKYKDSRCVRRGLKSINYPIVTSNNKINVADEVLDDVIDRIAKGETLRHLAQELNIGESTLKTKVARYKRDKSDMTMTQAEVNSRLMRDLLSQKFLGERPVKDAV